MKTSKRQYWAVIWGDNRRITGDKYATETEAKLSCFGLATSDMRCVPLGSTRAESLKRLTALLAADRAELKERNDQ